MRFNNDLLKNLTPQQRLLLLYEAMQSEDEAEISRLVDTTPRYTFKGIDRRFRDLHDSITGLSLAIETDLRGYALSWFLAIRSGQVEVAHSIIDKMSAINTAYLNLLREIGLSGRAIRAARPEMHDTVKSLLRLKSKEDTKEDPEIEKMFNQMKSQLRI